jgi:hypothetical protein
MKKVWGVLCVALIVSIVVFVQVSYANEPFTRDQAYEIVKEVGNKISWSGITYSELMTIFYANSMDQDGGSYYQFEFREPRGGHSTFVGYLRINISDGKIYQQNLRDTGTDNWHFATQYSLAKDPASYPAASYAEAYLGILGMQSDRSSNDLNTYGGNVAIEDVFGGSVPELIFISYRDDNPDYPGLPSDTYESAYINIYAYENGSAWRVADSEDLGVRLNDWNSFVYTKAFLSGAKELYIYHASGQSSLNSSYSKYETINGTLAKTDMISEEQMALGSESRYKRNGVSISKMEFDALEQAIVSKAEIMLLETYSAAVPEAEKIHANTSSLKHAAMTYDQAMERLRSMGTMPAALVAVPAASKVFVNGENLTFDAYNIGGANYVKLRDLAYAISGTEKQFDVGWDAAANAITLTSGWAYTAAGGEMASRVTGDKSASPTNSKIYLDGNDVVIAAYNIDGNNYFKLRDIGQTFDFGVDWDSAANTVMIDTGKGYASE